MRTNELKRIAEENDYVLTRPFDDYKLEKKGRADYIYIGNMDAKKIWFPNLVFCDDKDFNMFKAAVEFAETPISERGNYED